MGAKNSSSKNIKENFIGDLNSIQYKPKSLPKNTPFLKNASKPSRFIIFPETKEFIFHFYIDETKDWPNPFSEEYFITGAVADLNKSNCQIKEYMVLKWEEEDLFHEQTTTVYELKETDDVEGASDQNKKEESKIHSTRNKLRMGRTLPEYAEYTYLLPRGQLVLNFEVLGGALNLQFKKLSEIKKNIENTLELLEFEKCLDNEYVNKIDSIQFE